MKRILIVLALCVALPAACLAEASEPSSTDRFLSGVSEAWDALQDMARGAGENVSQWADESGVSEWLEGAANDISVWAKENGLTDWAEDTVNSLSQWLDESGVSQWTSEAAEKVSAFVEENRPAIEAWLSEAGQEVRKAWDTLVNPDRHTPEELETAYETVTESLEEMTGE